MDTTRDLKENRSLLVMILLSIITFGIYELYYIHTVAKDTNTICEGHEGKTSFKSSPALLQATGTGIPTATAISSDFRPETAPIICITKTAVIWAT